MHNSILYYILRTVEDNLYKYLNESVPADDPMRARLIRTALLQDDPTRFKVSVLVLPNDPDDDKTWHHELSPEHIAPSYQIGGGEMWLRRFTATVNMYWSPKVKREQATEYACILMSRVESVLTMIPVLSPHKDAFGEWCLDLRVKRSYIGVGGGEGQFINYGKVWFEVLTEKTASAV